MTQIKVLTELLTHKNDEPDDVIEVNSDESNGDTIADCNAVNYNEDTIIQHP